MVRQVNDAVVIPINGSLFTRRVISVTLTGQGLVEPYENNKQVLVEDLLQPWQTVGRYELWFPNLPWLGWKFVPTTPTKEST